MRSWRISFGKSVGVLAAALVVLFADVAAACPSCAASNQTKGFFWWIVGAMLLLPFVVVAVAISLIRKGEAQATPFASPSDPARNTLVPAENTRSS